MFRIRSIFRNLSAIVLVAIGITLNASQAVAAQPSFIIVCQTGYSNSTKPAAYGFVQEQRSCSMGIKFASRAYPNKTTNRVVSCNLAPGTPNCFVNGSNLGLPTTDEWIPTKAWTEKVITGAELALGCVYAEGFPQAVAFEYIIPLAVTPPNTYIIGALHRYDCANLQVPASQFQNVGPAIK